MIKGYSVIVCLFLIANILDAQHDHLLQQIKDIVHHQSFEYASVGISVQSIDGEQIIDIDSDKKLIPASSFKLITTLTALELLGRNYEFSTKVGYNGTIDRSGTLQGDIVIIASGDPTLGSSRFGADNNQIFNQIVKVIQAKGIKCIDGRIDIRTNVFEGQSIPGSWPIEDISNYYGSGAWSLNFNENEYNLYFNKSIKEGEIATVHHTKPHIPYLNIESKVFVKGPKSGDHAYIYGDAYSFFKIVRGSIPLTQKLFVIRGAVPNPPLAFAAILSKKLMDKNVSTAGFLLSSDPIKKSEFKELLSIKSPKLSKIIKAANYESINLYCESILRLMGKKEKNEGSIKSGIEVLHQQLVDIGIDEHSFRIEDGSGLSPRTGITPATFTTFLNAKVKSQGIKEILNYIPRTGESGTVKSILNNKSSQKQFFLKSGSLGGVLSYTGLFKSKSGKWYSICFISNNHAHGNYKIKVKAEEIFQTLYSGL